MAKALTKPQPRSSVDRFFNQDSLSAALEQHDEDLSTPSSEDLEELLSEPLPLAKPPAPAPTAPVRQRLVREVRELRPPVIHAPPIVESRGELIDRKREFRLTKSSDETLEELVSLYKSATGADLTRSHVMRALLRAIDDALPSLRREAEKLGPLRRPSNWKGHEDQRDEFEASISDAFKRGMRG